MELGRWHVIKDLVRKPWPWLNSSQFTCICLTSKFKHVMPKYIKKAAISTGWSRWHELLTKIAISDKLQTTFIKLGLGYFSNIHMTLGTMVGLCRNEQMIHKPEKWTITLLNAVFWIKWYIVVDNVGDHFNSDQAPCCDTNILYLLVLYTNR